MSKVEVLASWNGGGTQSEPVTPPTSQADANYVPASRDPARHCSICRHYLGQALCALVENTPSPIYENGVCALFEPLEVTVPAREMEGVSGKGFIALAVRYAWEVQRFQGALMDIFGYSEDFYWQDPSIMHITLFHSDDISDDQLAEAAKAVIGQSGIMLKFNALASFVSGETQAIYLAVEENEALRALQKGIYDNLVAQGVTPSPLVDPAKWVPHMTMLVAPSATVIPNPELNIDVWCADEVVFSRDQYRDVLRVNLSWQAGTRPDIEGTGPVSEMAKAKSKAKAPAAAHWKVGAARDLPVKESDDAWDGAVAAKGVFEAAGFGTDKVDAEMARQAFLVYNASAPELKGSYKLGIAEMVDGKLQVSKAGLRQAASRLRQVKGVPTEVLDSAEKVLNAYEKKAGIGDSGSGANEMQTQPTGAVIEQSNRPTVRITTISEMRGAYPDIPLPEGVDVAEIERVTGEKPFFVTLPIGRYNAQSNNGRTYLRSAVEDMVNEINASQPYGGWGHLTEQEMSTRFDPPAVQWLAALVDEQGVAWGKALPQNKETRDYYKLAKATGSRVATSLAALAEMDGNKVMHLALKRVDIADPARAGIPDTLAAPRLTSEMAQGALAQTPAAGDVFVQTSTGAGAGTRVPNRAVITKDTDPMETKEVLELQQNHDRLQATVTEQAAQIDGYKTKISEYETREQAHLKELGVLLSEFVNASVSKLVTVEAARALVTELVIALQPQTRDEVAAKVQEVLDRPSVQTMLKGVVTEMMGSSQVTPPAASGTPDGKTPAQRWLNDEPKSEGRVTLPSLEAAAAN